ncbi:MAG: tRNA glutamyl-Q(34) synthetase GluQRS [Muribaculaceae bacterium]|nr:tRNA glutamyl-Q(34) synthetase GluQRS [Muribaculaceae bacterium]
MSKKKGRFAPSPTGRMHLGNVVAALLSWVSAKRDGGSWLLRIEDLDPQRSRYEYARQIEDDLSRLGLDWDEGGLDGIGQAGPYVQSMRGEFYEEALRRLDSQGLLYGCTCTRADILATQAPHQSDGRVVYSGRCRPAAEPPFASVLEPASAAASATGEAGEGSDPLTAGRRPALRVAVGDEDIRFVDRYAGECVYNLRRDCGDFIVRRSDGAWAYQLAVVVDDALMGVTEVVRGEDLLLSTAQQIHLYRLLGYEPPEFAHFPLITNADGQRLSKRDRAESLESLFARYTPREIIGMAAYRAGLIPEPMPVGPGEVLGFRF